MPDNATESSTGSETSSSPSESFGGSESSGSPAASTKEGHAPGSAASLRPTPGEPSRNQNGESRPQSAQQKKEESRYERTKRERAEFRSQQEAFRSQQQEFAKQRAEFEESKKPKRDYTLSDLKKYRNEWAAEAEQGIDGRADLVAQADREIKAMEQEELQKKQDSRTIVELPKYGTPEHRKQWEDGEREIHAENPEFMVKGTRIDSKMREILGGPHAMAYKDHPQGIWAAYDRAQKELLQEDNQSLKEENESLKAELQKATGRTSIGGGVPGRIGLEGNNSTKDFSKLTSAEMRKRLLAHRGKPDSSMPWL
jgi:hypothetical protein